MHIYHLFADDAGTSRVGRVPLTMSSFVSNGERTPTIDVEEAFVMSTVAPFVSPLHASSRAQLMVVLQGRYRFITTAGDTVELGPGETVFADDAEGSGHTTELVEDEGQLLLVPVVHPAEFRAVLKMELRRAVPKPPSLAD